LAVIATGLHWRSVVKVTTPDDALPDDAVPVDAVPDGAVPDASPPDDPEVWSDEQWLAWLAQLDESLPAPGQGGGERHWRERRPSRAVYGAMLALHDVIYGPSDPEPQIVIEAAGGPPDPESLEVHLSADGPDESTVVVRPWLIDPDR
jgi:hypothetical protein